MTLVQLRNRAQQRFRDVGGLLVGDSTWTDHINAAYRHFLRAARWPFLVTTSTASVAIGERMVPLTATVMSGLENVVDDTNKRVLEPMPVAGLGWRLKLYLNAQVPGQPAMYSVVGQNLYLIPPPKALTSLKIHYFADPASLAADADVPAIPERYQEALVVGAVAKASIDDQNLEAAERYSAEFDAILAQAVKELMPGRMEETMMERATGSPDDPGLSADRR